MIYLASTSPRRRQLLKQAGIQFKIVRTSYVEKHLDLKRPSAIARALAHGKALHARVSDRRRWVLAADTLIYFEGQVIGKPRSMAEARRMLKAFSGKTHTVYSAIALYRPADGAWREACDRSRVTFRRLDDALIRAYLKRVPPLDKAGGYAVQDGKELIWKISGSFTNVMGLPMETLKQLLAVHQPTHV